MTRAPMALAVAAVAAAVVAPSARAMDTRWSAQRQPAPGPALAIGAYANGCLAGAVALPATGPGYQVLHLERRRTFGHPDLIGYVRRLAVALQKMKLPPLLVGDLAQPRGGPTPTGHRSHQSGLDVDLGYARPPGLSASSSRAHPRAALQPVAVVDLAAGALTPAWKPAVMQVLEVAASDPAVDRIFVNPIIKRELCARVSGGTPWLGRVRPWWGHHDHFHVRLRCPADSPDCQAQEAPPVDDGCGPTLAWWFTDEARTTAADREKSPAVAPPPLPSACEGVLVPAH